MGTDDDGSKELFSSTDEAVDGLLPVLFDDFGKAARRELAIAASCGAAEVNAIERSFSVSDGTDMDGGTSVDGRPGLSTGVLA